MTIKAKIKSLHEDLKIEINNRNDYYMTKSESWYNTNLGEEYSIKTDILIELYENIETIMIDLGIGIKRNK